MTTSSRHPVTAAQGMPETVLPDDVVAGLPATAAPAPWSTRCRVTTWWHKPRRESLDVFPEVLRPERVIAIAWSVVQYSDTPVGPYDEIVAAPIPRGGRVHIPFICVDSPASVVGGRANWLLPKALASFERTGRRSVTVTPQQPTGPAWSVTATARPLSPPLPFTSKFAVAQCSTDGAVGSFPARMRGLARYASVTVDGYAEGPLAALLRTGRHRGVVVTHGRFTAGPTDLSAAQRA
jgi:hypothetical protein